MIRTLDLLYICLSLAALVFAGFFAYAAYHIATTVKEIRKTIENVETTTSQVKDNLTDLSEGLKYGVLGLIAKLIGRRGGEKYYDA